MQPNRLTAILASLILVFIFSCNQATKEQTVDSNAKDPNASKFEMCRNFYTAFEKADWPTIEKMLAPDFKDHSPFLPPGGVTGRDSAMKGMKEYKDAFPNLKFEILSQAANNDMVFIQYHFTGSNDGPFMGMPATNKKLDFTGVDLIRVSDSVALEHWDYGDNITYMKQMGLMP
jgi:predicted ester cyclase